MNDFLRKAVMSEPLFDDWDDFISSVDGLVEKGIVERYTNENGEISLRLTEIGQEAAEMIKIKELAKEDMGVEKYRKSENRRKAGLG
jgi:DNA-binding MarR family transcriptional regulator